MFNLPKIRVIEFLQLSEEAANAYIRLQKVMKPKGTFAGKTAVPVGQLSFGQVKRMQREFKQPTFEQIINAFKLVYGASKHQVLRSWITDFFYAANHLIKEISATIEKENKAFAAHNIDQKLKAAGIERLNAFGELNQLFDLAERFGKDPEEIENWKYNKVIAILLRDHMIGQISEEYQRLTTKQ